MKNNRIQFEQYLKNVYRPDNGKPLKPKTINDYTCLCNKAGEYLGMYSGYIFEINTPSIIKHYMPEIQQLSTARYQTPTTLIAPVKAYINFLQYKSSKQLNRNQ